MKIAEVWPAGSQEIGFIAEIAKEIIWEYGVGATITSQKINDIIAKKVMERMKEGTLITKPDDKRETSVS